ncbi:DUF956 family protein [[Clostridium] colinum]|uniref:DUF956 family protein n=1 Tax=[Clostridium] colinum TaxID=36835 RepID=UPI0020257DCF|nr:DUF956 family protein [[Clostridium] colinum]
MVQSLNSKVDLVKDAIFYSILPNYGKIMIGDAGFEFYNNANPKKCIQIKWSNINYITASVMLKNKWIQRFAITLNNNKTYYFSAKQPKEVLRAINVYIPLNKMFHSLTIMDRIKNIFKRK